MMYYSCKTKKAANTLCVTVIQNSLNTPVLSKSEIKEIKSLFEKNRIDDAKYQFYRFNKDDLGFTQVRCYQYANGLRIFTADLIFHFNQSGEYFLLSGDQINSIKFDTQPSMDRNRVAAIFFEKIAGEKASMVNAGILKGCFEVELGYVGLDDSNKKFAKAWKVKPAGKDYPFAYINDDNAEIIFYDNGVRT